jgi:Ca2+-dependent lipid-binding protein
VKNQYGLDDDSVLVVRVVEARNLMPMDYTGKSDPYVVLQFGSETFTTRYIKQDLNPVWNEVHTFDVISGREQLKIEVFDKDEFGTDDHLGFFLIPDL